MIQLILFDIQLKRSCPTKKKNSKILPQWLETELGIEQSIHDAADQPIGKNGCQSMVEDKDNEQSVLLVIK